MRGVPAPLTVTSSRLPAHSARQLTAWSWCWRARQQDTAGTAAAAVAKAGLSGVHFHDLRHTGNTLTADAGANLRELMDRMGHSSTRAALIYLHSSGERQRTLADAVGQAAHAALHKSKPLAQESGTYVARDSHDQP
ncbi:MAG: tyrosine-type recombinase/integrase [Streptosporangiaceae bacterium]